MKQLKDKVIVITGAGSGIGRALALHAAAEGAMLAINDWDGDSLGETAHHITKSGAECLAIPFDVSKQEEMDAFADEVVQRYGRVDIMINNAGQVHGFINIPNVQNQAFTAYADMALFLKTPFEKAAAAI